jgi:hypothetical protein
MDVSVFNQLMTTALRSWALAMRNKDFVTAIEDARDAFFYSIC